MSKWWRALLWLMGVLFVGSTERAAQSMDWMDRSIAREFYRFEWSGISLEMIEKTWKNCQAYPEFRRYQVIDRVVYGPPSRIRNFLEVLVQEYPVPDVDFIYYYEDRLKPSFFKRKSQKGTEIVFVSAKDKNIDQAILFCDWVYDIQEMDRGWNHLIREINALQDAWSWSEKVEQLFWRGTPWDGKHFEMYDFGNWTAIPRGHLVFLSRQSPSLINAAFSRYPGQCVQDLARCEAEMGPIDFVPWKEVLHFKYQMSIDGVTCSFPATYWKLLSHCLTFVQASKDIQFFSRELLPWVHYVPVKNNLSDLTEKILWAKHHDEQAERIARNAREFALTHLMPEHIKLYCYKTLVKYASLQRFQPTLDVK